MKRLLMIAFQFPPFSGSSGVQRALGFARYLPRFGWEPLILTAHARAYERVSDEQLTDLPAGTIVERAFALDAARHLAVKGRYPAFAARPDRWSSWWLGAVPKGLRMTRKYRPSAVWSTYPVATAHMIGKTIHRLSGLPWIADFRDPMAQDGYPVDPKVWRSFKRIEEDVISNAAASVFVAPGAARMYRKRYPAIAGTRLAVIENGYEEESFAGLDYASRDKGPLVPGTFTLLHSGVVYPSERDPTQLFRALRLMLDEGGLRPGELRLRLRAPSHEAQLTKLICDAGVEGVVELAPLLPNRGALEEMLRANGLLVLQASNCNEQIPAKVYEYLRCRRPILALTDPAGDTAELLRNAGIGHIARLDSVAEISRQLRRFMDEFKDGRAAAWNDAIVAGASRQSRTEELAGLLDRLSGTRPAG